LDFYWSVCHKSWTFQMLGQIICQRQSIDLLPVGWNALLWCRLKKRPCRSHFHSRKGFSPIPTMNFSCIYWCSNCVCKMNPFPFQSFHSSQVVKYFGLVQNFSLALITFAHASVSIIFAVLLKWSVEQILKSQGTIFQIAYHSAMNSLSRIFWWKSWDFIFNVTRMTKVRRRTSMIRKSMTCSDGRNLMFFKADLFRRRNPVNNSEQN